VSDPEYFYPWVGLAEANLVIFNESHESSWFEKAKQATRQAGALSTNRPEAQIQVAKIQMATGNYEEAIGLLENALQMNPTSDEAYRALGRAQLLSGNTEHAISAYQKAIDLDPRSWLNYNSMGSARFRLGQTEEAERAFRKAIELEPKINDNYTDLGNTYLQSGKFQDAIRIFEKALTLEADAINYSNLATALFYLQQYQSCVPILEKAMELAPNSEELMGNLADAYRWSGQTDKATKTYFAAVDLSWQTLHRNPKDADTRGRMAVYYAKMGDLENARSSIRTARAGEPKNGSLQYEEAVISTLAGNLPQAKAQIRSALSSGYPLQLAIHDPELRSLYPRAKEIVTDSAAPPRDQSCRRGRQG
jgi:tetratricopeptide (TPR) repeat protein